MPDRLPAPDAVKALDAIVWPDDPRVTERDVLHQANVVLYRAAPASVRAAWDRVRDRCTERFGPVTRADIRATLDAYPAYPEDT